MRILGIDPGSHYTGVGVIESQGNRYRLIHEEVLKLPGSLSIAAKLYGVYRSLSQIVREYHPDVLALENIFYHKDIRAVVRVGEVRACAMLAASEHGVNVVEYAPNLVKQSVTGNGRASKQQVQHMVKTLLNLKSTPPADGADALAVAICHAHQHKTVGKADLFQKGKRRRY